MLSSRLDGDWSGYPSFCTSLNIMHFSFVLNPFFFFFFFFFFFLLHHTSLCSFSSSSWAESLDNFIFQSSWRSSRIPHDQRSHHSRPSFHSASEFPRFGCDPTTNMDLSIIQGYGNLKKNKIRVEGIYHDKRWSSKQSWKKTYMPVSSLFCLRCYSQMKPDHS